MSIPNIDIQRQLEFQRQSRRLSRVSQKSIAEQLSQVQDDIQLQKQHFKKTLTQKNESAIHASGKKLIELLAKKTSINIYELHQTYKKPPEMLIKQLVQQYTKEALIVIHLIKRIVADYGHTTIHN